MQLKETDYSDIQALLGTSKAILLTGPANPDYDVVGSSLALASWVREQRPQARVETAFVIANPHHFKFLPGAADIRSDIRASDNFIISVDVSTTKLREMSYDMKGSSLEIYLKAKEGGFTTDDISFSESNPSYDLIITVGAPELASVGPIYDTHREVFFKTPILNIDRSSRNTRYGSVNSIHLMSSSIAEVVAALIGMAINKDRATCLLTGLIAGTNSFQAAQVTPDTLALASALIVAGAPRAEIVDRLFRNRDMAKLKLWGSVLSRIRQADSVIVYSDLSASDVGDAAIDLQGMVDDLVLASPEADIVAFFYGVSSTETRVYLFARENYDLPLMLHEYAPVGSRSHVICEIPKPQVEVEKLLIEDLKNKVKAIKR